MFYYTLKIALALVLLAGGAELLVRGAAAIAVRAGVSALAVGLTVVAFGTSTPELVVSVRAASIGVPAIAVGNIVGSNIANVALILALSALLAPITVQAKIFRLDAPVLAAVTVVLSLLIAGPGVSRPVAVLLCAYTIYIATLLASG